MTLTELEQHRDALGKGRAFVYAAKSLAATGNVAEARVHFEANLPRHFKAAVPGAVFTDDMRQALGAEFLKLSDRKRVLPQLVGAVTLPPYLRSPLVDVPGLAAFVAEGAPIPAFRYDLELVVAQPTKLGMLLVITQELARSQDERAVGLIEKAMTRTLTRGENSVLLGSDARVQGETPGGLLSGLSPISGSPTVTADDIQTLFDAVSDGAAERPYFVLSARAALHLRSQADANAGSVFSNVSVTGGDIAGIPCIVAPEAADKLILIDAAKIGVLDEGLDVQTSEAGALVQDDAPAGGPQSLVSAFQTNSAILRLVRYVDWVRATDDGVAYIDLPIAGSPA